MRTFFQKLSRHNLISLITIAIFTSCLILGPSKAESSWWQKSLDVLKGVETSPQSTLTNEEIGLGLKDANIG